MDSPRADENNFSKLDLFCKKNELRISDYPKERTKESEKKEADKREKYKREEKARIEIAEAWDSILFAQVIRGFVLVIQSILRK